MAAKLVRLEARSPAGSVQVEKLFERLEELLVFHYYYTATANMVDGLAELLKYFKHIRDFTTKMLRELALSTMLLKTFSMDHLDLAFFTTSYTLDTWVIFLAPLDTLQKVETAKNTVEPIQECSLSLSTKKDPNF